ncbi:MAG TPA: TRAP transporter small permease [Rectinema sp.]|nr:TRAP transporter small permease [Rectinema sp.]HPN03049.1 TRAP transporter small permease [Rectinema sp.]
MDGVIRKLRTTVDFMGSFFLILSACLVFIDVLNRNIFKFLMPWTGELTGYFIVWFTFIAGASVVMRKEQLRVEYFQSVLPKKISTLLKIIERTVSTIFYIFLAVYGFKFSLFNSGRNAITLPFTMFWPTLAVSIGGAFMAFFEILNLIAQIKEAFCSKTPLAISKNAESKIEIKNPPHDHPDGGKANDY